MNKNIKNILVIIIYIILFIPIPIEAEIKTIKPGTTVIQDYYFFNEGDTTINKSELYNGQSFATLNYAAFGLSLQSGEQGKIKNICIALPKSNGNYRTYYGEAKITSTGWDKENSDIKVQNKCYDVWTKERFDNEVKLLNNVEKKYIDINNGYTVFNKTYPYKKDNKIENKKLSQICTRTRNETSGLITKNFYKHYGNIKYTGTMQEKVGIFNNLTESSDCPNGKCELSGNIEGNKIECTNDGNTALTSSLKEETKTTTKVSLLNNKNTKTTNSKVKLINNDNGRLFMYGEPFTVPVLENGQIVKKTIAPMCIFNGSWSCSESEKKYLAINPQNNKVIDNNEYVLIKTNGTTYSINGKTYKKNNNSYNNSINYENGQGKLYLVFWDTQLFPYKDPSNHPNGCYLTYTVTDPNNNKETTLCHPLYQGKQIPNNWKTSISNYNDDSYRDVKQAYRCKDNKDLYYITFCQPESSTAKCKYIQKNGEWVDEKTIDRNSLQPEKECPAQKPSANPSTSQAKEVDTLLTDVKVKNTKNEFKIARYIENINDQVSDFSSINSIRVYNMPAVVVFEHNFTCTDKPISAELTCSNPQAILKSGYDNSDCVQYITSDKDPKNAAIIKFQQKGNLKVNLNNTYIKAGESFSFKITYEDIVSYNIESQTGNIDNSINDQIKKLISESELFNGLKNEITLYKENNKTENIGGEWTFSLLNNNGTVIASNTDRQQIGNRAAQEIISSKTIRIRAEFQLYDAWTNINIVSSKGVDHKYQNKELKNYTNDGKVYYTDLDLKDGYYKLEANIKGLSALKYNNGNNYPFWQAKYTCGVQCIQEFYGKNSLTNSDNKKGYKFTYREINNTDPFPIKSNTQTDNLKERRIGLDSNWITWASAIGGEQGTTTEQALDNVIVKRLANAYNEIPDYITTINTNGIITLREYNKAPSNNYYSGVEFLGNTASKLLRRYYIGDSNYNINGTAYDKQAGIGVQINSDMFLNKVGYCGDTRLKFNNNSEYNTIKTMESTITDTDCFCLFVDTKGNCVLNRNLKGVGIK